MEEPKEVLELAFSLGDEGRWDEMAGLLAAALKESPDDPYLLCWLGVAEREMDRPGAAYDLFKRCVAQDPEDPQLLALAGAGLAAFDDPDAETTLRAAALTGPDLPFTRLQYGAYLAREGLFEEALIHLNAAIALAPDDPTMHGERGIALALQGNMQQAAESMERALDLAPDDSWTRLLLGLVLLDAGDEEDAAAALLEAAADRPEDFEAQVLAALSAAAVGWEDRAEEALARAGFAEEGRDAEVLEDVEDRLASGARESRELLREALAPSILHERLVQPL